MYVECYSHPWKEQAITMFSIFIQEATILVIKKKTRANEIEE
jgi:hypothetical protein